MTTNKSLVEAMLADLRASWDLLVKKKEKVYAFGVYTTEDAAYLIPFACGEKGLKEAARRYVKDGYYKTLKEAAEGLRWSVPDSPYQDTLPSKTVEAAIEARPDVYDLPATKFAREVRLRLNSATAALKQLDEEGLFGEGADQQRPILLIMAGDCSTDFVMKWAAKLNPQAVVEAFAALGEEPTEGEWESYGTKKTYESSQLSASQDHGLIAVAGDYFASVFDVAASPRQVFCQAFPDKKREYGVQGVSLTQDGGTLAVLSSSETKGAFITLASGPRWANQQTFKAAKEPLCFIGDPAGRWYAVATMTNAIHVYDGEGKEIAKLKAHGDWPRRIATNADGTRLASVDSRAGLCLWDTQTWSLDQQLKQVKGNGVSFHPRHNKVVVVDRWSDKESPACEVDLDKGGVAAEHRIPGFGIELAVYSDDGSGLACYLMAEGDAMATEAVLIDLHTGKAAKRLRGAFQFINDFAFLPKHQAVAVAGTGESGPMRPLVLWL